jgi:hypothetical protein
MVPLYWGTWYNVIISFGCVSCIVVFLACFVMCRWVYVGGVFLQLCGCFGNVYLYLLCFVLLVLCFYIVSFMYIYSYLFCLFQCKDYCHRAKTQLQSILLLLLLISQVPLPWFYIYFCDINLCLLRYDKNNKRRKWHALNNSRFGNVYTLVQDNGNKTGVHFSAFIFTPSPARLPKAQQELKCPLTGRYPGWKGATCQCLTVWTSSLWRNMIHLYLHRPCHL